MTVSSIKNYLTLYIFKFYSPLWLGLDWRRLVLYSPGRLCVILSFIILIHWGVTLVIHSLLGAVITFSTVLWKTFLRSERNGYVLINLVSKYSFHYYIIYMYIFTEQQVCSTRVPWSCKTNPSGMTCTKPFLPSMSLALTALPSTKRFPLYSITKTSFERMCWDGITDLEYESYWDNDVNVDYSISAYWSDFTYYSLVTPIWELYYTNVQYSPEYYLMLMAYLVVKYVSPALQKFLQEVRVPWSHQRVRQISSAFFMSAIHTGVSASPDRRQHPRRQVDGGSCFGIRSSWNISR